jgi:hypothetical protein
MQGSNEGARIIHEQVTNPEASQLFGAGAVFDLELQGQAVADESGADTVASNLHNTDTATTEMPDSHANFTPETLTPGGVIKACKYLAGIAAKNPALAERLAGDALRLKRHEAEMRLAGMDAKAIRSQTIALMREQRRARMKAKEKEIKPESSVVDSHEGQTPVTIEADNRVIQSVETGRPDVERASAATAEASAGHYSDDPTLSLTAVVGGHERKRQAEQPEPMPQERVTSSDYDLASRLVVPAEAKVSLTENRAPIADIISPEAVQPERVLIDGPANVAATLTEKPAFSPVAESDPVYGEAIEQIDIAIALQPEPPEARPPAETLERLPQAEAPEQESLKLYAAFTQALQALAEATEAAPEAVAVASAEPIDAQTADGLQTAEMQLEPEAVPAIVRAVAERLSAAPVEEKETTALILQEVVVAVRAVETLQSEAADTEIIEAAVAQLKESIVALFTQLGIEHEPEDIERFMHVLLRPDFRLSQPQVTGETTEDIEHSGTHEIKRRFTQIVSGWADAEQRAKQLLGMLALFHVSERVHQAAAY